MARIRTVKPEFWSSPDVGDVSRDARLLFLGLLNIADDHGRLEYIPQQIAGVVFPYDDDVTAETIDEWVRQLGDATLVRLYRVRRRTYLFVTGWERHQYVKNPSKPRCPDPDGEESTEIPLTSDYSDDGQTVLRLSPDHGETLTPGTSELGTVGTSERKSSSTDVDKPDPLEGFDEFWEVWPPRGGKKIKRNEAEKHWKRIPASERPAIMLGAKHYAEASRAGTQGAKDAFRWLRDREWPDWQTPADTGGGRNGPPSWQQGGNRKLVG